MHLFLVANIVSNSLVRNLYQGLSASAGPHRLGYTISTLKTCIQTDLYVSLSLTLSLVLSTHPPISKSTDLSTLCTHPSTSTLCHSMSLISLSLPSTFYASMPQCLPFLPSLDTITKSTPRSTLICAPFPACYLARPNAKQEPHTSLRSLDNSCLAYRLAFDRKRHT